MRLRSGRGVRRRCAAVLVLLFGIATGIVTGATAARGEEARAPRVTGFSAETRGAALVVELALSAPAAFTFFILDEPRRLVVDYASTDDRGPDALPDLPPAVGTPRFGLAGEGRARMVLPLSRPFAVARAEAAGGDDRPQIRLTLAPVSPERFAAEAGWPEGTRQVGAGAPLPPPRPGDSRIVVMIDPGHGGNDPGAMIDGVTEKDVVLDFSRRLADRLNRSTRMVARLTRERDVFLPLGARVRAAQRAGAHLFLSIHADIVTEGEASGLSLYTLAAEATDAATAALAERENRADILSGAVEGLPDDVAMVLIDLAQRGTTAESRRLAQTTLAALAPRVELLHTRPHREANFRVLKAPEIPSLLVELGFLTSERDRARLLSPEWQDRVVEGLAQGILDWAEQASAGYLPPGG